MKRIIIIRHGETDYNVKKYDKGSLMSQPVDSQLNSNGIDQAKKTGIYLKRMNEKNPIDFIISSSTLRSKQTAELIAKEINFKNDIVFEEKLSELKINNKYKNLTREEFEKLKETDTDVKKFYEILEKKKSINFPIERNDYLMKVDAKKINKVYEDSESITSRLNDVIETLKILPFKNIVIVTHGGIIKWLTKILCNIIGYDEFKGEMINDRSNCAITYLLYTEPTFYLFSAHSNKHLKYIN